MKSDQQRSILIAVALGLIPVIWLALLMAPYLAGGLPELLANLDQVLASPFAIRWCSDSPRTVLIFAMLYLVGVGIVMSDQKNYRRREEYGSAKWGSVAELAAKYGEKRKEFLLFVKTLTMAVAISFQVWIHKRNLNVVVIGGSGSGKTRSYVYENLLNANTSFVVLDPKGEIVRMTGSFLEEEGYDVRVLDLIHMEKSHCFNPYVNLRNVDDIQRLATSIMESASAQGTQGTDPFWNDSASIILKALICYQHYVCPIEEQNFDTLMEMLRSAQVREEDESYQSPLDILFERLREKDPDHIAVKFYDDFKIAAGKTAKSILITLLSKLEKFNIPSLAQLTMTDEMDLRSLGQKKTVIFAVVPDSDTSFNFLVSILYEQAFQILYEQADTSPTGRLPVHVHFLMDEFANVAIPKDFEKKLATMRSREISVSIILQSLSQLKALYEKQWEGLIANCDSMLYLGGNDQFTHEYISKSLGKETIDTNTYGKSSGRSGSYSTNYQSTGRELMTPDEVRKLDNSKAILFIRGEDPVIDRKYDLKKHPNYHRTAEDGGKPYIYGTDKLSFAAVTLDQSLLRKASDYSIDVQQYELLSPEDLEAELNKKENKDNETVQEEKPQARRKPHRPRQG